MLTHYPLNTTGCIALSSSVPGGTLIGHLPFTKRPHFPPQFLAIKIHDHSNGAHSFTRTYQFPRNRGDTTERPRCKMASTSSFSLHHPSLELQFEFSSSLPSSKVLSFAVLFFREEAIPWITLLASPIMSSGVISGKLPSCCLFWCTSPRVRTTALASRQSYCQVGSWAT